MSRDISTHNRSQNQSHIGHHSPKKNKLGAILGIEHAFDASCDNNGRYGRQKSGEEPADDDTRERRNDANDNTEDLYRPVLTTYSFLRPNVSEYEGKIIRQCTVPRGIYTM